VFHSCRSSVLPWSLPLTGTMDANTPSSDLGDLRTTGSQLITVPELGDAAVIDSAVFRCITGSIRPSREHWDTEALWHVVQLGRQGGDGDRYWYCREGSIWTSTNQRHRDY
jgi:hypothetical protein